MTKDALQTEFWEKEKIYNNLMPADVLHSIAELELLCKTIRQNIAEKQYVDTRHIDSLLSRLEFIKHKFKKETTCNSQLSEAPSKSSNTKPPTSASTISAIPTRKYKWHLGPYRGSASNVRRSKG